MNDSQDHKEMFGKNPVVSVIMPAYNCAGTMKTAIDSVLRQDTDLELIVINDCSMDDLDSVMKEYQDNPVISYVKNEKNLGASGSRNKGVELSKGRYIAFLDSDDWWEEGKLKKQIACLEKTGDVLCCTARELVTPDGKRTGRIIPVKEKITYHDILHHNSINCSSVLLRASVMKEYRMEHEDSHEDYILWMKILKKYQTACGINEPLLKYRLSSSGKSGSKLKSAGMTYRAYRYAGFGKVRSVYFFCCYAVHGVFKYLTA